jgi:predicted amidohydrolase YtcJ
LIRKVIVDGGKRCHALIQRDRVVGLSDKIADAEFVIDGNGGRLVVGLVDQHQNLYRLNSLAQADIPVAAGSDAPYGPVSSKDTNRHDRGFMPA